ncbi:MAG: HDOD domain-containing protein [Phycisphaerales bacterium]
MTGTHTGVARGRGGSAPASLHARARQVELILERVDAIPTLSPIAARVLKLGSASDVEMDALARVIETDPALTVRILGMCRRSDKGLGDRITSVKRAVVMLGLEAVRSAVLAVSVYDLLAKDERAQRADRSLAGEGAGPGGFDRTGFWKHSVAVACAGELIAAEHRQLKVLPEEAFLAGLLHGVGRIILSSVLPRAYDGVQRLAERRGIASAGLEHEMLGIDHHSAGRRVAAHWGLPTAIQDVIWLHDQPKAAVADGAHARLVLLVTAARTLCRRLCLGQSGDFGPCAALETVWADAGVGAEPQAIAAKLHGAVALRLGLLGIDAGTTPELMLDSLATATHQLAKTTATLHERARLASHQSRVLDAVAAFQKASPTAQSFEELSVSIFDAADTALGTGRHGLLVSRVEDDEELWALLTRGRGEVREHTLAPPAGATESALVSLLAGDGPQQAPALTEWIGRRMGTDGKEPVLLIPLGPGRALLTDAPVGAGQTLAALTACWSAAIETTAGREQARRLEEQLVHANRTLVEAQGKLAQREALARLGETAAGAAHEFNNPLTVIAGRADLLMARLQGERDKAAVAAISSAAQQISGMIASMHLLSRVPAPAPGPVNLVELVRRSIAKAKRRTGARIEINIDLLRLPESFVTDGELFVGALVELLSNALEACPRGPVTLEEHREGDVLRFTVTDRGPGLTEHAMKHAYDPFFSEREAGRGRGMGLTRARVMAQALGGDIHLESAPGDGCRAVLTVREFSRPA